MSATTDWTQAAGICFVADGKVLLMRRGNGGDHPLEWAFPGGHHEPGETIEETARREAFEETGFRYEGPLQLISRTRIESTEFTTYLAHVQPFPVVMCPESIDYRWVALEEVLDMARAQLPTDPEALAG
jgi:8-oxo-dGTP pyrophosphatase MutT (NUDIX family)